jgi:hypothetical protein
MKQINHTEYKPQTIIQYTQHMKNFEVTLLLVVNASRDIELSTPETKQVVFNVDANSEHEARTKAKEQDTSGLSVWESYACEN